MSGGGARGGAERERGRGQAQAQGPGRAGEVAVEGAQAGRPALGVAQGRAPLDVEADLGFRLPE